MQFTLRQVQLFVAVCDAGSVTQAAVDQHVAQSAVSTAIKTLERVLNVTLFVRGHAIGVTPTPEGRELLRRARELIVAARDLESFADTLVADISGPIHIGFLVTIAPVVMPQIIRGFEDGNPGVRVIAIEDSQDELIRRLRLGEISLAVTYDLMIEADIAFSPLRDAPPRILMSPRHPLAERASIALAELTGTPLILLDLPVSSDYFLDLFRAQRLIPTIGHRSPQMDVVRSLVGQNLGYTLLNLQPASNETMDGQQLRSIPLSGNHRVLRLGVASIRNSARSATTKAMVRYLTAFADESPGLVPGRE